MSRAPWLFIEDLPRVDETAVLPAEEGRHGGRAHRLRPGDTLTLTDGRGQTAQAELLQADRREALVRILAVSEPADPPHPIQLVAAVPKGERMGTLLAMATQLGMSDFTPLECERSVVHPSEEPPERWERILRENIKQSHQAWLPNLSSPATPQTWRPETDDTQVWILDPQAQQSLGEVALEAERPQALLIGPEGGFTSAEQNAAERVGARAVALGNNILRIETAAIAALSVLRVRLGS